MLTNGAFDIPETTELVGDVLDPIVACSECGADARLVVELFASENAAAFGCPNGHITGWHRITQSRREEIRAIQFRRWERHHEYCRSVGLDPWTGEIVRPSRVLNGVG